MGQLLQILDLSTEIILIKAHAHVRAHPLVSCILEYLLVQEYNSIKSQPTSSYEISNKGPWALIWIISVIMVKWYACRSIHSGVIVIATLTCSNE